MSAAHSGVGPGADIPRPDSSGLVAGAALGWLGSALAAAYLAGATLPFVHSDRDAFLAVLAIGWLGCMAGAGPTAVMIGWTHPVALLGTALGVGSLAVVVSTLAGWSGPVAWTAQVAGVPLDRAGLLLLAIALAIKPALAITTLRTPERQV